MFYITNTPLILHCTDILCVRVCVSLMEKEGPVIGLRISEHVYASTVRWRSTGSVNRWIDGGIKGSLCAYVSAGGEVCVWGWQHPLALNKCYATDLWVKIRKEMNVFQSPHSAASLLRIEQLAVTIHPQYDLLHSSGGELDFKPSLNTGDMSLPNFPVPVDDVSG